MKLVESSDTKPAIEKPAIENPTSHLKMNGAVSLTPFQFKWLTFPNYLLSVYLLMVN